MPIRQHHRWLYPIDWPQLSAAIRFPRAKGRCEGCGRPHGRVVLHLGDGRWWDDDLGRWRNGAGRWVRRLKPPHSVVDRTWRTRVVLSTCHRDHDPTNDDAANLAALCQRCHIPMTRTSRRARAPAAPVADVPTPAGHGRPVRGTLSAGVTECVDTCVVLRPG